MKTATEVVAEINMIEWQKKGTDLIEKYGSPFGIERRLIELENENELLRKVAVAAQVLNDAINSVAWPQLGKLYPNSLMQKNFDASLTEAKGVL